MSWGTELWDRLDLVLANSKKEIQELDSVLARFVKERGEVEKEYAKNLKHLHAKYTPKEKKKEKEPKEESTQTQAFRSILRELGFQANQHETLAETLVKTVYNSILTKSKEFTEQTSKNKKEAKKLFEEKEKSDKQLERSKVKYQRCYLDWEVAEAQFTRADTDKEVSRNEIGKLKKLAQSRQQQADEYKGQYASQLLRTNEIQRDYYYTKLPAVINSLQSLDIARVNYVKETFSTCLKAEMEIQPIIAKCHEDIENIIQTINPTTDTELVIDRLKTGNVPPPDFPFEEMKPGGELNYQTLHKRSRLNLNQPREENSNLFPKKRELEKKIEALEAEIQKGHKEMKALQVMYQTYSQNPKYGDKKKFQDELDTAAHKVQLLESELHSYKTELAEIETKLENLRNRTPVDTPKSSRLLRDHSPSNSDMGSAGYGTISNSSGSDKDTDSLGEKVQICEPHWEEEEEFPDDTDLPPPPPLSPTVKALYDFQGEEESNLAMVMGEEFIVMEEDAGGWTKVQRPDQSGEGFVPTAFLKWL